MASAGRILMDLNNFVQKAEASFHFFLKLSLFWLGFCQVTVLNMAKSLPRKVKVGFRVAMASQSF